MSMREAQEKDCDFGPILSKMSESEQPTWDDIAHLSEDSKAIWRQWNRLVLRDGVWCRTYESPRGEIIAWQIIMPRSLRRNFLQEIHAGFGGGHLGRNRMERKIRERAYWPGWSGDVREFLRACPPCARYHRGKIKPIAPLAPIPCGDKLKPVYEYSEPVANIELNSQLRVRAPSRDYSVDNSDGGRKGAVDDVDAARAGFTVLQVIE
jgi:hypothetical protein